jgi:hypothetical protein
VQRLQQIRADAVIGRRDLVPHGRSDRRLLSEHDGRLAVGQGGRRVCLGDRDQECPVAGADRIRGQLGRGHGHGDQLVAPASPDRGDLSRQHDDDRRSDREHDQHAVEVAAERLPHGELGRLALAGAGACDAARLDLAGTTAHGLLGLDGILRNVTEEMIVSARTV